MSQQNPPQAAENGTTPAGDPAVAADAAKRRLFRMVVIGVAVIGLPFIGVIVFLQMFVAQRIPDLTEARLEAAEQLWQQQGPASYDMDIEIRGARPGGVHIEVRDGEPIGMTRDGRTPQPRTWSAWSVPGLFELLERELVLAEDPQHEMNVPAGTLLRLRCDFDPRLGFPRRYHRHATGGAPEVFWRVTAFNPK